jgi:hypothetical protein
LIILVFNVGEYRRDAVKFYADKDFFDPDNAEAVAVRKYLHIYIYFFLLKKIQNLVFVLKMLLKICVIISLMKVK